MAKNKLSPPTWDEQNQRWKKVAYCWLGWRDSNPNQHN